MTLQEILLKLILEELQDMHRTNLVIAECRSADSRIQLRSERIYESHAASRRTLGRAMIAEQERKPEETT